MILILNLMKKILNYAFLTTMILVTYSGAILFIVNGITISWYDPFLLIIATLLTLTGTIYLMRLVGIIPNKVVTPVIEEVSLAVPRDVERMYKNWFRTYFEGNDEYVEAVEPMSICTFGITNFQVAYEDATLSTIRITITLTRPGLLIGRHGRLIDALTKTLSVREPVKFNLIESKLWN